MCAIVLIIETHKMFRVKILENFEPFDWLNKDWKNLLPAYNAELIRMFASEEPFDEFEIAVAYADEISFAYAERMDVFPELEIINTNTG